jgi:hypothetical protein
MSSAFRNAALAGIVAGLVLDGPAQASWLVDFNEPALVHLQFFTPTFLTSDTTTTFSLVTTSSPDPVSQFSYGLAVGATCIFSDGGSVSYPGFGCTATSFGSPLANGDSLPLTATGDPHVYAAAVGDGTLIFTNLVPEPGTVTLLAVGLACLGLARRHRRA